MKRLKTSTIKQYDNGKLLKHLDRLLDQFAGLAPFRICNGPYHNASVFELQDDAYHFAFSSYDRESILDAINKTYNSLKM